jgi:hypothetical protein
VISLKVNAFKDLFFDRPAVRRAADDATWKALSRSAFLVRTIAQRSMRYRKWKPGGTGSPPGQPPYALKGRGTRDALIRKLLLAGFDPRERVAVVGPALLDRSTGAQRTLEFGGTAMGPDRRRRRRIGSGGEIRITTPPFGKPVDGKPGTNVVYTRILTAAQADRATRINDELHRPQPVRVAARPYMGPALEKAAPKLPRQWARSVNGG